MNLLKKTKFLLKRYQISPSQHLGQNFIVDPSIFRQMTTYASLSPIDVVLDIGAGLGFLTQFLAEKCKKVLAIELDSKLVHVLCDRLRDLTNVEVIPGDVLQKPLPQFTQVVSAPPYHISSSLISWLFHKDFKCAILILQKEFVNRLIAPIGSENYGWLTVVTHYHAEIEPLKAIPPMVFYPEPQVESLLIRLKLKKSPPLVLTEESMFVRFVQTLFTHRNRKVRNGILSYLKRENIASEKNAVDLADSLPFNNRRIRELTPKEFGVLANALSQ